jgi:feruloyl-CoA synthase
MHVRRAVFIDQPLSIDAGELTDKGSLNSSAIRERRRDAIEQLYSPIAHAAIIAIG